MLLSATICHMSTGQKLDVTEVAKRLRHRREDLRMEQTEVAERARLSRAYVSRLESGLVPNPKLLDLQRVADVLGLTLSELVVPEPLVVRTRFSHDLAALEQQLDALGLTPEIKNQIVRGWRESVDVLQAASGLARRN